MATINPFGAKIHAFGTRPPERDKFLTSLEGSVRSGKTWGMHLKMLLQLCTYSVGGRKVIVGSSKGAVYRNVLIDLFDILGVENYKYAGDNTGELTIFPGQKHESKWIVIGAKDERSFKTIQGMTVGIAYVDEVVNIPKSFFDMLYTRMSPPGSRIYTTCNPGAAFHWFKTEYLDNHKMRGLVETLRVTMDDNPNLSGMFKRQQRAAFSGVFYQRFIEGLWVSAEGAIYGSVWPKVEIYTDKPVTGMDGKQMPLRPIWLSNDGGYQQRVISIDYGTHNPCVFLDWYDTGKRLYLDREFYWDSEKEMRQKTDAEYADDLEKFAGPKESWRGLKIVVDPSATSFKAELADRGFYFVDADNDVLPGIMRVSSVLNLGVVSVNAKCENTIREWQSYIWDAKKAEKGEEAPVKKNDHSPDAGRYGIMDMVPEWRLQSMGAAA